MRFLVAAVLLKKLGDVFPQFGFCRLHQCGVAERRPLALYLL